MFFFKVYQSWPQRFFLILAGIISALALPPVHAVWVLFLSLPFLLLQISASKSSWNAFWTGWLFGFGRGILGYYWIGHALLIEPDLFGWLVPFAVAGLAAATALYAGCTSLALYRLGLHRSQDSPWYLVFGFAVTWVLFEWVQSWLFSGFAWNYMGTVWTAYPSMLQSAAFWGVYGLSFVTILGFSLPYVLIQNGISHWKRPVLCAIFLFSSLWAGGEARLHYTPTTTFAAHENRLMRLVQPNIPQELKWDSNRRQRHFEHLLALSARPSSQGPLSAILWPETAVPYFLEENPRRMQDVQAIIPQNGVLMTGILRRNLDETGQQYHLWNSLQVIDSKGKVIAFYDKSHLVPFGEYMPFSSILSLTSLLPGPSGFATGRGPQTLTIPGIPPVGASICYEIVFPSAVVNRDDRPQWILNVTNDGWYGVSSGPYQHLASAQMRAVEEGLSVVRVANTGISAVIDPFGRIIHSIALNEEEVLDFYLPKELLLPTIYSMTGNYLLLFLCVSLLGVIILIKRTREKSFRNK